MAKSLKEKNQLDCNKRARKKYAKEKTTSVAIHFMHNTEVDLLEYLKPEEESGVDEDCSHKK